MISLVAQLVKHLPTMRETWVRSVVWEDPLEKEMATHLVFLPGKSHGWKEPTVHGVAESDATEQIHSLTQRWHVKYLEYFCG